ncbi:MAG: GumC family protein [Thermoguttaceae bacterium]
MSISPTTPPLPSTPQNLPAQPDAAPELLELVESAKLRPQILALLIMSGLFRHWRWALPVGAVLAAIVVTLLLMFYPAPYAATAILQVDTVKQYYVFNEDRGSSGEYDAFVNTQILFLQSPVIIEKALEQADVAQIPDIARQKDPAAWISQRLSVNRQPKSELINVTFLHSDSREAQSVANAIVNAYFRYLSEGDEAVMNDKLRNIRKSITDQKLTADLLQREIREKMDKAVSKGTMATGGQGKEHEMTMEASLQRDLYIAEAQLESLTAEYQALQNTLSGDIDITEGMLSGEILRDPYYNQLLTNKQQLQERRQSQATRVGDNDVSLRRYDEQIAIVDADITKYLGEVGSTKKMEIAARLKQSYEEKSMGKKVALDAQRILVDVLRKKQQKIVSDNREGVGEIVDVSFQQALLARTNTTLDLLSKRETELQTEMSAPNRVHLRRSAAIPKTAEYKKKIALTAMAAFACFCGPFLLAVVVERLKPRLYHVSQIREAMPTILIGEIMEPPVAWIHGSTFRHRLARYRESVQGWCTHLLLSDKFRHCRSMAVASVNGDDGKTFLAIQIAVAMAQMRGGSVLLIDGDMRVGRLHRLFGNDDPGIGLADILAFRNKVGEAITMDENEPNLYLLSAGVLDSSPYEILGDGRFNELLQTLANRFEFTLVVLPPVANAAESLLMASAVDSVLLCVRQGETVVAAMDDVYRKLVRTGSHVEGIVVKDIPYYQMSGRDGGFSDRLEQVRLAHLLQHSE